MGLLVVGIIWLGCGIAAGHIHQQRGRSMETGFWAGVLLGPLGVLLALVSKPDPAGLERAALSGGKRKCPSCAELVQAEAKVCRYCQRDLPPLDVAEAPQPQTPPAGWSWGASSADPK